MASIMKAIAAPVKALITVQPTDLDARGPSRVTAGVLWSGAFFRDFRTERIVRVPVSKTNRPGIVSMPIITAYPPYSPAGSPRLDASTSPRTTIGVIRTFQNSAHPPPRRISNHHKRRGDPPIRRFQVHRGHSPSTVSAGRGEPHSEHKAC